MLEHNIMSRKQFIKQDPHLLLKTLYTMSLLHLYGDIFRTGQVEELKSGILALKFSEEKFPIMSCLEDTYIWKMQKLLM